MSGEHSFPFLARAPEALVDVVLARGRRVLVFGRPGVGKSTLVAALGRALARAGRRAACIGADPGSPAFGVPGAVCLGHWHGEGWHLIAAQALCSLNPARFRLPLISAIGRLAALADGSVLLVDAPGVVRGVAGAELLAAMVEASRVDTVLALVREHEEPAYATELAALGVEAFRVAAAAEARRPGEAARARWRTRLWDAYLERAQLRALEIDGLAMLGTPPPLDVAEAWPGRQVALLDDTLSTLALGEAVRVDADRLWLRLPAGVDDARRLLVRDARRDGRGRLVSARRDVALAVRYAPPTDVAPGAATVRSGPRPVAHVGAAVATLVNGIFGDPLLHLRLRHHRRSLLFDLGDAGRLPARIAHQVTDVFVSHAHFDHIAGFLWLLRSRIADLPACRMFGPPGLGEHVAGMMRGICWDRIGDRGPCFEVAELDGECLRRVEIRAGRPGPRPLDERPAASGLLVDEPAFRVRAVTLDHGTPVLAFAFAHAATLNVRKERLSAMGLSPGPWLTELKRCLLAGDDEATIELPGAGRERARVLGEELVLASPGGKLVYATDLADSPANRARLTALAAGAHTFFCEAVFLQCDAAQAARTGHLTARACGEIASAAAVSHLVPFHFSRRYEVAPERVYDEVARACSRTVVPGSHELGAA